MEVAREHEVDVLVVDDDPNVELVMGELLAGEGRRIHYAGSGGQALRMLRELTPAAVLLDVELGDLTGFEVAQLMRDSKRLAGVPVVFMSGHATEMGAMLAGYDLGAVDYLVKPLIPEVVRGKVAALCSLAQARQQLEAQLADLIAVREQLVRTNGALARLASTDPLTGLPNRRELNERLARLRTGQRRADDPHAIVVIDLDGFKAVNDEYGHDAGDQVLVQAAARLRSVCRENDVAGRWGGDEFCVLAHGMGGTGIVALVERLQQTLDRPYEVVGRRVNCTASIGAAVLDEGAEDPVEAAMATADEAMYAAKARRSARDGGQR